MRRIWIAFPYLLFLAMMVLVVWSNVRAQDRAVPDPEMAVTTASSTATTLVDPVCKMAVNKAWGFSHTHAGNTVHFCSQRCRETFVAEPASYVGQRCVVCDQPVSAGGAWPATYLDQVYHLCSQGHRQLFKADPAAYFMHRMWGIPDWLYYLSIALVLLVSFLMFEGKAALHRLTPSWFSSSTGSSEQQSDRLPVGQSIASRFSTLGRDIMMRFAANGPMREPTSTGSALAISLPIVSPTEKHLRPAKVDLMRFGIVRLLMLSRPVRFVIQLIVVALFILIIAAGIFGNQNPALNIAPLLTWTVWWCGLVVLIMFAGKAWCYMCPWDAIAGWTEKLRLWKKTDQGLGLGLKWPHSLRNVWPATFLFIVLTWVELGFGVTMRPMATAYLAIAMLVLAIVSAFLFERKSFCRYGCLVGRVSGLYAMFGGVEVRHRDEDVCASCHTKECVRGSETAYGCPTFENPGKMAVNTYCIQCAECLQACPHENMTVNLRPWGADLAVQGKPRSDEAYLALLMLAISSFHGLTMTPLWGRLTDWIEAGLPLGRMISFSAAMATLMAAPILVYAALVWWSYRIVRGIDQEATASVSYRDYFIRYAYCVLPIALFYHLAHNLEHLLMEGPKAIALASDPFGWGWNVFGTAAWRIPPMVSLDVLWLLQVILVGVGHVYSLWAARKISRRVFADDTAAAKGQWPLLVGMIAFSVLSLWLLKQPMEMRTSTM